MSIPLPGDGESMAQRFSDLPEEVQGLALGIAELISRTSRESRYHLSVALQSHEASITGDLVLRLPSQAGKHVVVKWVGGGLQHL